MTLTSNRILKMMAIIPKCHWCDRKVIYYKSPVNSLPDNFATVDHLYRRDQKEQRQKAKEEGIRRGNGHGVYYVLACNKCNVLRSKEVKDNLPRTSITKS